MIFAVFYKYLDFVKYFEGFVVFLCYGSGLHSGDRISIYRVSQEECARLRESVPYVKLY